MYVAYGGVEKACIDYIQVGEYFFFLLILQLFMPRHQDENHSRFAYIDFIAYRCMCVCYVPSHNSIETTIEEA